MKANKNLKFSRKGNEPLSADNDSSKSSKQARDKSSKRRLSIYDDFDDEESSEMNFKYQEDEVDEEDE